MVYLKKKQGGLLPDDDDEGLHFQVHERERGSQAFYAAGSESPRLLQCPSARYKREQYLICLLIINHVVVLCCLKLSST